MRFGDPNTSGQMGHITVHTCIYHVSPRCPVDHLCSHGLAEKTKMFQELIYIYVQTVPTVETGRTK